MWNKLLHLAFVNNCEYMHSSESFRRSNDARPIKRNEPASINMAPTTNPGISATQIDGLVMENRSLSRKLDDLMVENGQSRVHMRKIEQELSDARNQLNKKNTALQDMMDIMSQKDRNAIDLQNNLIDALAVSGTQYKTSVNQEKKIGEATHHTQVLLMNR